MAACLWQALSWLFPRKGEFFCRFLLTSCFISGTGIEWNFVNGIQAEKMKLSVGLTFPCFSQNKKKQKWPVHTLYVIIADLLSLPEGQWCFSVLVYHYSSPVKIKRQLDDIACQFFCNTVTGLLKWPFAHKELKCHSFACIEQYLHLDTRE